MKFIISKLGMSASENFLLLELYNQVDATNIFILLEVFQDLDSLISSHIGAKKVPIGDICVMAKYLQNSYELIRYKR